MFSKFVIYHAYLLKSSPRFKRIKRGVYNALENPRSQVKSYVDMLMIGLIVISIFFLLYDVEHETGVMGGYFEQGVITCFACEYLLRVWVSSDTHLLLIEEYEKASYLNIEFSLFRALKKAWIKKFEYILSPMAIIDLLAILPSYRPLRILRIFLIFRLFKLFRYSNSARLYSDILASKRFELLTLLLFSCLLVFIASVSVFIFEFPEINSHIKNLFDAFYWSIVTMATVGYGDITPQTHGGKIVAILLILTSIGVLSFFTSILISAFNEKIPLLRENQVYAETENYKNFIIICGFGRVGQEIAKRLHRDKQKFIIIDKNEQHVEIARQRNFLVIHNDASKNQILLSAGINRGATTVLCTTGDDVTNVYVTLTSRHLNKNIRIISRANQQENVAKLYQAGADQVIKPFEVAGLLTAEFLGQPVAFEAISGILQNHAEVVMDTLRVNQGSELDDKQIIRLELAKYKLTLLGVISANPIHLQHRNKYLVNQQHFYFNPDRHFVLHHGDILLVLGRKFSIDHFRDLIERRRLMHRKNL